MKQAAGRPHPTRNPNNSIKLKLIIRWINHHPWMFDRSKEKEKEKETWGERRLQWPHHGAWKSTRTKSKAEIADSKLESSSSNTVPSATQEDDDDDDDAPSIAAAADVSAQNHTVTPMRIVSRSPSPLLRIQSCSRSILLGWETLVRFNSLRQILLVIISGLKGVYVISSYSCPLCIVCIKS